MISTTKKYNNHDQNNCHHVSWHVYKIIIVSGNLTACNRTSTFWIRQSSTSGLFSRENSEQILECEWITCVKSWKVKPSRREPNLLRPWLFQLLHICAHGAIVSLKVGRPAISNRRKHCELLSVYSSTIIIYHTLLVGGAMCPSWKNWVNGKGDIPYMKWKIKMFQTTNQINRYCHIYTSHCANKIIPCNICVYVCMSHCYINNYNHYHHQGLW